MSSEAKRKYDRDYHAKRSPEKKLRKQHLQRERIKSLRRKLIDYKISRPCKCGEGHPACLDFHHVSGDKDLEISNAVREGWAWERILSEIAKCILLCSNCHRKLHYEKEYLCT